MSDDRLARYRDKRDFTRTAEPAGSDERHDDDPHFVIQHHLATADHYDFRLEIDGVLVSWAVPKGPSTDPRVRRMAKRTEDHPMAYESFEGTIGHPRDPGARRGAGRRQYGTGTVQVWDRGTFRNVSTEHGEPIAAGDALARGHLSVELHGEKVRGGYRLIHTHGRGDDYWLLIKKRDEDADARRRPTSTENRSVLTGRTMTEIADDAKTDAGTVAETDAGTDAG